MCCFAMNGAVFFFEMAVLFRDRLPPFKSIIIWSEMANLGGDYNTPFTLVYKDMDLHNEIKAQK